MCFIAGVFIFSRKYSPPPAAISQCVLQTQQMKGTSDEEAAITQNMKLMIDLFLKMRIYVVYIFPYTAAIIYHVSHVIRVTEL